MSKNQGGASGAYQYVDSTWNNYEGYASAYLAPPEIQDARAATDVQAILATYGDVAYVPIVWYWPRAATDPSQLDIVPMPDAGNRLTVREYQQRWLATYETKAAGSVDHRLRRRDCRPRTATPSRSTAPSSPPTRACSTSRTTTTRPSTSSCPRAHPSTPCAAAPSPASSTGPTTAREVGRCEQTCGVGLSINGDDGARYIYCHGTRLNGVAVGDIVTAGQLLMWSGNTGRSGAPHLHFEIRVDGQQRCPQPMLRSIYETSSLPCSRRHSRPTAARSSPRVEAPPRPPPPLT